MGAMSGFPPSKDDVRRLAETVIRVGDDVRVLLPDNTAPEYATLAAIVRDGACFTARMQPDIVVFDADRDDAVANAHTLADELEATGLRPVVWASGSPGHCQLVVRIKQKRDRNRWIARGRELGMDHKSWSRPPLSPHRSGVPVGLISPQTVEEALERLRDRSEPIEADQNLTSETWDLIWNGDGKRDSDNSQITFRIACGMVAKGWSREKGMRVLLGNLDFVGARKLRAKREQSEHEATRWWTHVWNRAEEFIAENPPISDPTTARLAIVELQNEALSYRWPNRLATGRCDYPMVRGGSALKCMLGICEIALKAGRIADLHLSVRHVADVSGLGSITSQKALRALTRGRWIDLTSTGTTTRASTYDLLISPSHREHLSSTMHNTDTHEYPSRGA